MKRMKGKGQAVAAATGEEVWQWFSSLTPEERSNVVKLEDLQEAVLVKQVSVAKFCTSLPAPRY